MSTTMQTYLESRLVDVVMEHAAGVVDMHYDCEDADIQMRIKDNKAHSIDETVTSFIQMGVDFFIDNDMATAGIVSFDRAKLTEMATNLINNPVHRAFLAQCALMLQGYQVGAKSMNMLAQYAGGHFMNN